MRHFGTLSLQLMTFAHPWCSYLCSPKLYKPWMTPGKVEVPPSSWSCCVVFLTISTHRTSDHPLPPCLSSLIPFPSWMDVYWWSLKAWRVTVIAHLRGLYGGCEEVEMRRDGFICPLNWGRLYFSIPEKVTSPKKAIVQKKCSRSPHS